MVSTNWPIWSVCSLFKSMRAIPTSCARFSHLRSQREWEGRHGQDQPGRIGIVGFDRNGEKTRSRRVTLFVLSGRLHKSKPIAGTSFL